MNIDGVLNALLKLAMAAAVIGAGALAVIAVLDRMELDNRAAERRALLQRGTALAAAALSPSSALACLDGGAGEAIENACEKAVFADAQSAASAVAYTGARLALLKDAAAFAQRNEAGLLDAFAGTRRALELDRFGLAAHVLATRDGCTVDACAAFAWLRDTGALKANLRVHAFDGYVARYAAAWNKSDAKTEPMAEKQPAAAVPVASAPAPQAAPNQPVASRYDFPSAASIPPVSIMNAEPPLPKEPKAGAENAASTPNPPVPPKRPQTQAATPPVR